MNTLVRQGRYLIEVQANDDDLRRLVKRHLKGSRLDVSDDPSLSLGRQSSWVA